LYIIKQFYLHSNQVLVLERRFGKIKETAEAYKLNACCVRAYTRRHCGCS